MSECGGCELGVGSEDILGKYSRLDMDLFSLIAKVIFTAVLYVTYSFVDKNQPRVTTDHPEHTQHTNTIEGAKHARRFPGVK